MCKQCQYPTPFPIWPVCHPQGQVLCIPTGSVNTHIPGPGAGLSGSHAGPPGNNSTALGLAVTLSSILQIWKQRLREVKQSAWGHTAEPGPEPTSDSRACAPLPPTRAGWACLELNGECAVKDLTLERTWHRSWHTINIQNGTPVRWRELRLHTAVRKKSHAHIWMKKGDTKRMYCGILFIGGSKPGKAISYSDRRQSRTFLICVPGTGTWSFCDHSFHYVPKLWVLFWYKVHTSMKNCGFLLFFHLRKKIHIKLTTFTYQGHSSNDN